MAPEWSDTLKAHKEHYRDRIIDAALALVAESGVTKTSMAGLAQQAGIGRATVYKYFPDVERALLAHVEREVDECAARIREANATKTDTAERVHAYVVAMLEHFASTRHRLGWATLDQADLSSAALVTLRDHITKLHQMLAALLVEGVENGSFRSDMSPDLNSRVIVKVIGSLRDDLFSGELNAEEAAEVVWALLTKGILAGQTTNT